jgi:chromosome segregation ATPase
MNISNFDEATGNELEVARTRLGEAEDAVETAKREWKAAKRRRREAKEAARRAKKRLRRVKEELALARGAVTEAQKIYTPHVARVAKAKINKRAIKRAKKETKTFSEATPAATTESVTDFPGQTTTGSEPRLVDPRFQKLVSESESK